MDRPAETVENGPVTLRRWRVADAPVAERIVTESLDHLRPWMPWAAGYAGDDPAERAAEFTRQCEEEWESGAGFSYAIYTGETPVGSCGLMTRIGPGGLEIGYWIHPAFTRRGLATAAAEALTQVAFLLPGIQRVEIHHDAANLASGGIPRKLGFTEVGRQPDTGPERAPGETGIRVIWRLDRPR
jgi:ribosomal-protein-serine acetyltransferase